MPTKKLAYSLSLASGLLLIACQPPVSFFFLAYVALVPLLFSLEGGGGRNNFFRGFLAGIVCYTGLVYWVVVAMNTYGGISIPLSVATLFLLVLYMALYMGCFTWSVSFPPESIRHSVLSHCPSHLGPPRIHPRVSPFRFPVVVSRPFSVQLPAHSPGDSR